MLLKRIIYTIKDTVVIDSINNYDSKLLAACYTQGNKVEITNNIIWTSMKLQENKIKVESGIKYWFYMIWFLTGIVLGNFISNFSLFVAHKLIIYTAMGICCLLFCLLSIYYFKLLKGKLSDQHNLVLRNLQNGN